MKWRIKEAWQGFRGVATEAPRPSVPSANMKVRRKRKYGEGFDGLSSPRALEKYEGYSADRFIPTRISVAPGLTENPGTSSVSSGLESNLVVSHICVSPSCSHPNCRRRQRAIPSKNKPESSRSGALRRAATCTSRNKDQTYAQVLRAELLGLHGGGIATGSTIRTTDTHKDQGESLTTITSCRKPSSFSSLVTQSPTAEPLRMLNFSSIKNGAGIARQTSGTSHKLSVMSSYMLSPRNEGQQDFPSATRRISPTPYKVLDAPRLADDWYRNVLDWSKKNVLSVALGPSLYLYNCNGSSTKQRSVVRLLDLCPCCNYVTSCSWSDDGEKLAVGTHRGNVFVFDVETKKVIRDFQGHVNDVHALAWNRNALSTGCDDGMLLQRDIRCNQVSFSHRAHSSRICSFKVSHDGRYLASGGNDNMVCIWEIGKSSEALYRFSEHTAAVKAMAWSPHRNGLLVTGGGSTDRTLRFWNTNLGRSEGYQDTGSQICNLAWSLSTNELVTTHGYSGNEIMLWKYPTLKKVAALNGHTSRVLQLAVSPEGSSIVTGAGDCTLRFWSLWPSARNLNQINSERTWHSMIR